MGIPERRNSSKMLVVVHSVGPVQVPRTVQSGSTVVLHCCQGRMKHGKPCSQKRGQIRKNYDNPVGWQYHHHGPIVVESILMMFAGFGGSILF